MSAETTDRMTKSQVVEQIRRVNASAPREWLERFDFRALERYLDRLRDGAGLGAQASADVAVG
ncbi:MAG: hypothetical protein ACKOEL_00630 [Planctomycetota bacterium]|jgi:hypothetical protein